MQKLKPVLQNDVKDCGVCCMQWIIQYFDGYVSLERLREDTCTDITGTSAYHIVETFKKWGFDSKGVLEHDITKEDIKFPNIVHLHLENGLEHFVVVKSITTKNIYLMDPGYGNTKMTLEEFNKLFTGHIIFVHPRGTIIKMDKSINITDIFLSILKKEKKLITKIIISSIIWSTFLIICSYYLKVGSNILEEDINLLKYFIFVFLIFTIIKVLSLFIREYYENHLSNLVDSYIYPEFIRHIFSLPLKNIRSRTVGEIITRVDEIGNIKGLFSDIFVSCFLDSVMLLLSIVILYFINKTLFLILIILITLYVLVGVFLSKLMYKKVLENINYHTDFNSEIIDNINMIESIKNLNVLKIILKKIEKKLSQYLFNNYNFNSFYNITSLIKNIILELGLFAIDSCGFINIYKGNLQLIDLMTFNLILTYCLDPIKNIVELLPRFNYIKATITKISEFANIKEEDDKLDNLSIFGDIVFDNVSYSYNNYDNILNNCNFIIKKGTHTLIEGKSGSGKSTICKIIYKENQNFKGNVLINGTNILDLSINTIRNNILYISQNEDLFTGSIKENILIGRDISMDNFQKVCQICMIDEIVEKKGLRYDSIIESSSQNISGGEKQRIILARGLCKDADIIILDEALEEVDYKLESLIIKNLRKYFKDKTIIYISHKNQEKNFENIIRIGENNELF